MLVPRRVKERYHCWNSIENKTKKALSSACQALRNHPFVFYNIQLQHINQNGTSHQVLDETNISNWTLKNYQTSSDQKSHFVFFCCPRSWIWISINRNLPWKMGHAMGDGNVVFFFFLDLERNQGRLKSMKLWCEVVVQWIFRGLVWNINQRSNRGRLSNNSSECMTPGHLWPVIYQDLAAKNR